MYIEFKFDIGILLFQGIDMLNSLEGKITVVTGASKGMGRTIAKAYAAEGAFVYCAARSENELRTVCDEIRNDGGKAEYIVTDVTDANSVENLFNKVGADQGKIDIAFLNAGGDIYPETVSESEVEHWLSNIDLNLGSAYICSKFAIPYLKKAEGSKIIFMGSGMGHNGIPEASAYSVAKSGVWMLTRILAAELVDFGISVNEICPGPVKTPGALEAWGKQETNVSSANKTEWVKESEDVVPLALFLATQPNVGPTAQSYSLMRRMS